MTCFYSLFWCSFIKWNLVTSKNIHNMQYKLCMFLLEEKHDMAVILNVFWHKRKNFFNITCFKVKISPAVSQFMTRFAHTHRNARLVPLYLDAVLRQSNTLISFFKWEPSFKMLPKLFWMQAEHTENTSQHCSLPYNTCHIPVTDICILLF